MKIHFLCKRHYTNKDLLNDRFGRLFHLPVQLARLGATVTVTAIDYHHHTGDEINTSGVQFRSITATPVRLPGLVPNLYRAIQSKQPDLLIASGDSHIGFIGWRLARRLRARFVYDVYDYYPAFLGNRIPGMKTMFRSAAKGADLVLCASEPLQQAIGSLNRRNLLVENGVDRDLFVPMDMHQVRESLGLEQKAPHIGYFGSITPSRGPLLIEACRRMRTEMPILHLVLAGPVTDVPIDDPWISYRGVMSQAAIPEHIAACDVVTIPYAGDPFNSMSGACKIAEYLACAKPVVATRISGHEQIFRETPGSLCDPDPDDMANALRRQVVSPEVAPFPQTMDWTHIGHELYKALFKIEQ